VEADRKGWSLTHPEFNISDFYIAAGFYSDPTKMIFFFCGGYHHDAHHHFASAHPERLVKTTGPPLVCERFKDLNIRFIGKNFR
jgi:hypothetical protein